MPLLGCGSHKFNLAVRTWIKQQPYLLSIIGKKVASVMKKASTLKIAAKLGKLTAYSTVCENDTRWLSTFQMLSRFFKLQQQLGVIVELLELLPTHVEVNILSKGLRSLSKFNQITVMSHRDGISFVEVRQIFDAVLVDYPDLDHHLGDKASIVESPAFENAVMRIASGLPLSEEQRCIAGCLLYDQDDNVLSIADACAAAIQGSNINLGSDDEDGVVNYAMRVEQRLKRKKMDSNTGGK